MRICGGNHELHHLDGYAIQMFLCTNVVEATVVYFLFVETKGKISRGSRYSACGGQCLLEDLTVRKDRMSDLDSDCQPLKGLRTNDKEVLLRLDRNCHHDVRAYTPDSQQFWPEGNLINSGTDKQSNFRPIAFHKNDLDFHAKELPTFAENTKFSLGPFLSSTPYTGNGLLSKNFHGWNFPHYWADPFLDSALFAHIALVREGHRTIHFAIKVALHVDDDPRSRGYHVYKALRREAVFYAHCLPTVQGDAVPRHYGVWEANTSWAGHVVISVMEFSGWSWSGQIRGTKDDTPETRMKIARTLQKIHDAGADHNQIGPGYNHHLLYDWRSLKPYKAQFRYGPPLCPELTTLGLELGFGGPNTFLTEDAEVLDAIAFFDKYLEEHSGVSRQEALDAQEKYLKEEWRLVGPQVRRTESERCMEYEDFLEKTKHVE
ncbi:hypothetical protein EDD85DRAFT_937312 [Armillaria nabsnona]|nr:hypothetical protein EDD85DRAFT_937312 [Armillaria nabsnona]